MRSIDLNIVATLGLLASVSLHASSVFAVDVNKSVLLSPAAIGTSSTTPPTVVPPTALTPPAVKKPLTPGVTPMLNPQSLQPNLNAQDKSQQVGINASYAVNIRVLEQRVSDLEQQLVALQRSITTQTTHTHSYRAPMCQTFVTLPNLKTAIDDSSRYPAGTGVCLNRFTTAGVPESQTSAPGK